MVGTCGNSCVILASKHAGVTRLRLISELHEAALAEEKERVQRFGGVVRDADGAVTDPDDTCCLAVTRTLGDLDMRRSGVCQLPTIRSFELGPRDTHVIVSSQPLWSGPSDFAPQRLAEVVAKDQWMCGRDLAEALMTVAFGAGGPTCDATILCAKLR